MKYFELNKTEKQTLKDFESGNFKSVKDLKNEKQKYKGYAKQTLNKQKNINIRISSRDLQKIKSKAIGKGIPYQTLISSMIHQYSENKIKEVCE